MTQKNSIETPLRIQISFDHLKVEDVLPKPILYESKMKNFLQTYLGKMIQSTLITSIKGLAVSPNLVLRDFHQMGNDHTHVCGMNFLIRMITFQMADFVIFNLRVSISKFFVYCCHNNIDFT